MAFYFSGHPNFAANQSVTVMEIITFESKAYKELDNKITAIADYIFNHMETARQSEEDMWVDSYEVCTFLKISEKTLQRLRVSPDWSPSIQTAQAYAGGQKHGSIIERKENRRWR